MAISTPFKAMPPQILENITVAVQSANSLQISWDHPISIGGAEHSISIVEYNTFPGFTTQNRMPLGHLAVVEADADAIICIILEIYPDYSNPILRRRIMIEDTDVVSRGIMGLGSMLVIDGHHLTVLFINKESCGVTCLTMYKDYTGTNVSGVQINSGSDRKQYNFPITGLIPGTTFFVRVAVVNEKSAGPFAFAGYPSPQSLQHPWMFQQSCLGC